MLNSPLHVSHAINMNFNFIIIANTIGLLAVTFLFFGPLDAGCVIEPIRRLESLPLESILTPSIFAGDDSNMTKSDDGCNITTIISNTAGQITSVNYPQPYPTNCQWSFIISVGDGHSIKIVIEQLDLNKDDQLIIIPSPSHSNLTLKRNKTYSVIESNATKHFVMDSVCCDSVKIQFTVGNHSNNNTGFSISYERNEKVTPKPTPPPEETFGWLQVYLCGFSLKGFTSNKEPFQKSIIEMAKWYYTQNVETIKNTTETVLSLHIHSVLSCPTSWPWSANCIQVNFSISVSIQPSEFSYDHLVSLWDLYRASDELLNLGAWEYEIPNIEWLFWFWIVMVSFILLFFCFLIVIIVKTKLIYYYFKRLKIPDFGEEMRNNFDEWRFQNSLVYPVFTAENSNRYRFLRECERSWSKRRHTSGQQKPNSFSNGVYVPTNTENSDDFDSNDEQHIYHSLTFKPCS